MLSHEWVCEECEIEIPFRKPELPLQEHRSEMNESKICPSCNEGMYFDDVEEAESVDDIELIIPDDQDA